MIGFLLALLSVLISPIGMFAFFFGILLFFFLPIVPRVAGIHQRLANLHIWLGFNMISRGAIVASEHGDLLLKRMRPDDTGTEIIGFNDTDKEFEDPNQAKKSFFGIPFAFADERHGFFFTLKDVALATQKKFSREKDELIVRATDQENSMYGVLMWAKGVFEFPAGTYTFVNLNEAKRLVFGQETADLPQRVDTYYQHSREPYQDNASTGQMVLLLAALIVPFVAVLLVFNHISGSGGGGGVVVSSLAIVPALKSVDWKYWAKTAAIALPIPSVILLLGVLVAPTYAFIILGILLLGFFLIPLLTQVLKISNGVSESLSRLLIKLGLIAYAEPVIEETPRQYRLREFGELENVDRETVQWHSFLGRLVGFTFEPCEDVWGSEVADHKELSNTMITDGGGKTNLPSGFSIIPEKQRAHLGTFVPSQIKPNNIYIWTGIAFSRFENVATGEKTFNRLEKSKEEHGGSGGFDDKSLTIAMSIAGIISLLSGIAVAVLFL